MTPAALIDILVFAVCFTAAWYVGQFVMDCWDSAIESFFDAGARRTPKVEPAPLSDDAQWLLSEWLASSDEDRRVV